MSELFDKALQQVPQEVKSFVDNSFDIVDQIHDILQRKGKTQRDLAQLLGKNESEVSKWMQGTHNFTIKSISKMEDVLGEKILTTPIKSKPHMVTKFIPVQIHRGELASSNNQWGAGEIENLFPDGLKTA